MHWKNWLPLKKQVYLLKSPFSMFSIVGNCLTLFQKADKISLQASSRHFSLLLWEFVGKRCKIETNQFITKKERNSDRKKDTFFLNRSWISSWDHISILRLFRALFSKSIYFDPLSSATFSANFFSLWSVLFNSKKQVNKKIINVGIVLDPPSS